MNILIIGSGAREHAIARAFKRSKTSPLLFCFASSINPGIQELTSGYMVGKMDKVDDMVLFCKSSYIELVIIGPEVPLAAGVVDELTKNGIKCVGPTKQLAQIESSKGFARDLMEEFNIVGNPKYKRFTSIAGVVEFLGELGNHFVVKADGLMGGKGVKVSQEHLQTHDEAVIYCNELIEKGNSFVIEEKLVGQEFSLMSFCDGKNLAHMPCVQDHKRAYENDTGPNTGGMGSYSSANHLLPFLSQDDADCAQEINKSVATALRAKFGVGYVGILYGGFIKTAKGVRLIEYNARFGDPEAMNVFAIMESDFAELCLSLVNENLTQEHALFAEKATVCKYAVPKGYPDNPLKDELIDISLVQNNDQLYLASVDKRGEDLYEIGSRTVAVVGIADSISEAEKIAECEINKINGPLYHRKDIGTDKLINTKQKMMNNLIQREEKNNRKTKLAILGSTNGTDMEAIIRAINTGELDASIEIVLSNKKDAYILERARQNNLETLFVSQYQGLVGEIKLGREEYDKKVMEALEGKEIDLIILIGYMRIISPEFIKKYKNKIINVHPSLLPAFAGGMDLNVHEEVLRSGVKVSGCTVHFVDEGVDSGKIINQKWCEVENGDTAESLKDKIQRLEGKALIEAVQYCQKNGNGEKKIKIKRALLSVFDKSGIVKFARSLREHDIEIISTGNTARELKYYGVDVTDISDFTNFPEMMEGRVKTLHPLVHGGILGKRDKHTEEALENNIKWVDLVVCNLYPFSKILQKENVSEEEIMENIDIGGPSMIRSAAKNIDWATVIVEPEDYEVILEEIKTNGGVSKAINKQMSAKAFAHTAQYDSIIASHFCSDKFPDKLSITYKKYYEPRYGENPHQEACVYKEINNKDCNIVNAKILQGKKLSYNNINDADGALATLKEFKQSCCVVVKHANPCGVAVGDNLAEAFRQAYNADSMSAFGGIIALNETCTKQIAEEIVKVFAEIVIAPDYELEALNVLSQKKNMRVLQLGEIKSRRIGHEFRFVEGGLLYQDVDTKTIAAKDFKTVTTVQPTAEQMADMMFAWKVLKHIKSNGILIAKDNRTIGVGAGQVSRVDAVDMAIKKSGDKIQGSILASDAFFPFSDSIEKIATTGIKAIIQPGGSIRDNEVIDCCNKYGIAMVFTGTRCFLH